jgi:hypothetical protein
VEILRRFRMTDCRPMSTPLVTNWRKIDVSSSETVDPTIYHQLIGSLMYLVRDTWCAIRLYRLFAHRNFEEQGSAPSHPRDAKCRRRPRFGPTILSRCSGPSDQRGTRGARLGSIASSHNATLKNEDQPPPSYETRSAESALEDKRRVTAYGHSGK